MLNNQISKSFKLLFILVIEIHIQFRFEPFYFFLQRRQSRRINFWDDFRRVSILVFDFGEAIVHTGARIDFIGAGGFDNARSRA